VKIVIDMNLSPSWVGRLASEGHDALHWFSIGPPNAPDSIILRWAREHGHVVLTHDLDFGAILAATGEESPSVVQIRTQDVTPEAIGAAISSILKEYESDLVRGALITLDERRRRIRQLPLR
jgi:predicted nuclease of predicted toxin-antitoxin system